VAQVTSGISVIPLRLRRLTSMTIHRLMSSMATEQVRELEDLLALPEPTDDRSDAAAEQ
jgi:hypothetical protein